jgi:hypothetical protein
MMFRRVFLVALGLLNLSGGRLLAERAPLSQKKLLEEADRVVVGEIVDLRIWKLRLGRLQLLGTSTAGSVNGIGFLVPEFL